MYFVVTVLTKASSLATPLKKWWDKSDRRRNRKVMEEKRRRSKIADAPGAAGLVVADSTNSPQTSQTPGEVKLAETATSEPQQIQPLPLWWSADIDTSDAAAPNNFAYSVCVVSLFIFYHCPYSI